MFTLDVNIKKRKERERLTFTQQENSTSNSECTDSDVYMTLSPVNAVNPSSSSSSRSNLANLQSFLSSSVTSLDPLHSPVKCVPSSASCSSESSPSPASSPSLRSRIRRNGSCLVLNHHRSANDTEVGSSRHRGEDGTAGGPGPRHRSWSFSSHTKQGRSRRRISNFSFRIRSSSVTSYSSSSSQDSSLSSEEFWNQYRRKPEGSFISRIVKRAIERRGSSVGGLSSKYNLDEKSRACSVSRVNSVGCPTISEIREKTQLFINYDDTTQSAKRL